MMADQIGIKDIARLAGVSQSTVSKVLKNYPGISEKTRERVMAVVDETGYIPNSVASALSSKTNNRIGLFIYINDRFQQIDEINMQYILGVFDEARRENTELVTVFSESIEKFSLEETSRFFHSLHIDAMVVIGLNNQDEKIHYLAAHDHMRLSVVDACLEGEFVSTVMIDHTRGQYDAADRICEEGDRVLYLRGKDDGYVTAMRLHGMEQLARDKHLKLHVENGEFSEQTAYEIVKQYQEPVDAIVCASDLMAIGAKRALPADTKVKLSGFDGIRLMGYAAENVITCRQDFYLIGAAALKEALRLRSGEKGTKVELPYTITTIHR